MRVLLLLLLSFPLLLCPLPVRAGARVWELCAGMGHTREDALITRTRTPFLPSTSSLHESPAAAIADTAAARA